MLPAPLARPSISKPFTPSMILRVVLAIRKKTVYNIHGNSNAGLPCKEKKSIEILKFIFFLPGVAQILHNIE